jgi:glucosamine--fructose-6-phosphate aminotransferase (isomerizing)
VWRESGLWRDVSELPETLEQREGVAEVAALLRGARRVVASGNGAAYYVAVALWLASLESDEGPEILAVPSGLLARGGFRWRPGDAFLAVSSSGEFRDLVEAVEAGAPRPYAAVTATPGSTLGREAAALALVRVRQQRAVSHTQAFCGAVAAALAVWAEVTGDEALADALRRLPEAAARAIAAAERWEPELPDPPAAVAFGSGPGWAAALEAALLLKEVAGVLAEGVETREAATSAMMALQSGHLALSLPAGDDDPLLDEAEEICRSRGATVLRAPAPTAAGRRLAAITTFPAAAALSARLGLDRGLNVDEPAWTSAYYSVARATR